MNTNDGKPVAEAIDAAEEIVDPLDELVEKVAVEPGAPFAPDVLGLLCELKCREPAVFEALRAKLKKAGCRVTALDQAIAKAKNNISVR